MTLIVNVTIIGLSAFCAVGCECDHSSSSTDLLRQLEERWTAQANRIQPQDKNVPCKEEHLLANMLDELGTAQRQLVLAATNHLQSDTGRLSKFERYLIKAWIIRAQQTADATLAVTVISNHCPRSVCLLDIEFYLAMNCNATLARPILVLTRAYRTSDSTVVKARIAERLAAAFPDIRSVVSDEGKFVEMCEQWYVSNADHVAVDPEYEFNEGLQPSDKVPLFKSVLKGGHAEPGPSTAPIAAVLAPSVECWQPLQASPTTQDVSFPTVCFGFGCRRSRQHRSQWYGKRHI
jgi:hypothetical protein